jgi:hypothetical protein
MLFLQNRAPADVAAAVGLRTPAVRTWKSRLLRIALDIVEEIHRERAGGAPPVGRAAPRKARKSR